MAPQVALAPPGPPARQMPAALPVPPASPARRATARPRPSWPRPKPPPRPWAGPSGPSAKPPSPSTAPTSDRRRDLGHGAAVGAVARFGLLGLVAAAGQHEEHD